MIQLWTIHYPFYTFSFINIYILWLRIPVIWWYCDMVILWYSWRSCSLQFWLIITLTYNTKWARHDSSWIREIKLAHILRNNCEYLQNNCEYLIHNYNNLYKNIRRADKLTSMTSFVAGCILIEPGFKPIPECVSIESSQRG